MNNTCIMSPTATALLLFVIFLGESFAGYSTGFRRTPKPNHPKVPPIPVVFPSSHPVKEDPLWVGQGGVSAEKGKTDGDASAKVDDAGIGIRVDGGVGNVPNEDAGTGPHTGSGHWVPSPELPPTGGKEVPHDVPHLPHREDTSVKLNDKNVKEDKVPDFSKEIPSSEEKEQPLKPDVDGSIDLPGKPHPEAPKTHGDGDVPQIPQIPPGSHPDEPLKEGKPDVPNAGADYDYKEPNEKTPPLIDEGGVVGTGPHPVPDVPPVDVVIIPPGVKTDTRDKPDVPNAGADYDYKEPNEKIPPLIDEGGAVGTGSLPVPDVPPGDVPPGVKTDTRDSYVDEKVPGGVSHEIPPGSYPGDGDVSAVATGGGTAEDYEGPDEKIPPVSGEEGVAGVGPLPDHEVPPVDTPVIPPIRIEVLEPYPMKVGNGNINLYELMEKLELSRFLHLIEEANLKDLLTSKGPMTIFAPSDYALSKLDANTIRALATNQELLRQFVLYHLVDGQIYGPTFDERDNSVLVTKFDRAIHINRYGTVWYVNGIPITTKDQLCRNGVIHILDSTLYPFPTGDLLETLDGLGNYKIYAELIRNAKLDRELKGNIVYTIFVPTDEAFSKMPAANLEWLKWDIPAIRRMFRQLTVNGMYYTTWIPSGDGQLTSIDEQTKLSLSGYPDAISVNGARLSQYDITASNGCIHTIDDIWFLSELGGPSSSPSKKND